MSLNAVNGANYEISRGKAPASWVLRGIKMADLLIKIGVSLFLSGAVTLVIVGLYKVWTT